MRGAIGIAEFRVRMTELLRQVQETGTSLTVTDRGRPLARVVAARESAPSEVTLQKHVEPPPAPAPGAPGKVGPGAALRHLFPVHLDEMGMIGAYDFVGRDGETRVRELPIRFVACPKCLGRGRVVRWDLQGRPVPEEQAENSPFGPLQFHFLDSCDHCEGRRVVPEIDLEPLGAIELGLLRDRAQWLERVEDDLRPYLARWQDPEDSWPDGMPF